MPSALNTNFGEKLGDDCVYVPAQLASVGAPPAGAELAAGVDAVDADDVAESVAPLLLPPHAAAVRRTNSAMLLFIHLLRYEVGPAFGRGI